MLLAQDFYTSHPFEIAIIGKSDAPDTIAMLRTINSTFMPYKVMALYDVAQSGTDVMKLIPFLADRKMLSGKTTVYICRNFTCKNPIVTISELNRFIRKNF